MKNRVLSPKNGVSANAEVGFQHQLYSSGKYSAKVSDLRQYGRHEIALASFEMTASPLSLKSGVLSMVKIQTKTRPNYAANNRDNLLCNWQRTQMRNNWVNQYKHRFSKHLILIQQRNASLPHCVNKLQYRHLRSNQMNFIQEHYNNKSPIQFPTQRNGLVTNICQSMQENIGTTFRSSMLTLQYPGNNKYLQHFNKAL